MTLTRIEIPFGGNQLILESGKLAKQANAAVTATLGGTTVLVAVCMSKEPRDDVDFFPLMVEYQEKTYAAGRIPGGFFKREGRPTTREILTARLIDRPIRPLFPEGFLNDVVVTTTVLSSDGENDPDIMSVVAASAALHISEIPFLGPIGAVRVAMVEGQFILNPTYAQQDQSEMDLVVVAGDQGIIMVEGEAKEVTEEKVLEGLKFALDKISPICQAQNEFRSQVGEEKAKVELFQPHPDLIKKVTELTQGKLNKIYQISDKEEREKALHSLFEEITTDMAVYQTYKASESDITEGHIRMIFDKIEYEEVRRLIFEKSIRADGRSLKEIRSLSSEVDVLPRTHGSSLFTRGQTQSLAVVTLGTKRDEQMIESLEGLTYENFLLHYNFPSFSVGEARGSRGPGRREIGHGALAAKAIKSVLPTKDEFPYTIRVVSEILESNGSSSMASVCAGCLSLMAAGVPIKNPVAGVSIGLVTKGNDYRLLTDIMGLEDHFGDMDYKVAGTNQGVTAIQLDLKIPGVPFKVLEDGIGQAKEARSKILENMKATIAEPRKQISQYAPAIVTTQVPVEKIGEVIGPGGKIIKGIMESTGAESIDIDDDGKVFISAVTRESAQKALDYINGLVEAPQVGKVYNAKVVKVTNFGAFCEFLPGRQGLVHVSELANQYVKDVASYVKVGDQFKVKLLEIDPMNRMNLSRKQAENL